MAHSLIEPSAKQPINDLPATQVAAEIPLYTLEARDKSKIVASEESHAESEHITILSCRCC